MRDTITHHTEEIAHIRKLLKERESSEEESSSPGDDPTSGSGSGNPTGATQQDDVKMEDVEDDSNLPQGTATQTNPTSEEAEEELGAVGGVDLMTPGEDQIIMEGGGTTPITLAGNQLLGYDDLVENPTRAVTPSGAVTESLSQMNMDSPTPTPQTNDPPGNNHEA